MREKQIALEADHSTVCKFESKDHPTYELVSDNIMELAMSAMKSVAQLSVPATIEGLHVLGRKMISTLSVFTSSVGTARVPLIPTHILNEIAHLTTIFEQLQKLLLSRSSVRYERAAMIAVDELVAVLSGCVMAFTKLEVAVEGLLVAGVANKDQGKAVWDCDSALLEKHEQLAMHKTCLNLMLMILQW